MFGFRRDEVTRKMGDSMQKNEMDMECVTLVKRRGAYRVLVRI
jgi:hypothetical protein